MKGLGEMMKQAQQMKEDMEKIQQEIAQMSVEGQSGGGLVRLTMNGKHKVSQIHMDDSLLQEDKNMLGDLIAAAVNDAANKIEIATKEKYASLTNGANIPGMSMPF